MRDHRLRISLNITRDQRNYVLLLSAAGRQSINHAQNFVLRSVLTRTYLMSAHTHYLPVTVEDVIDEDASPALYPLIGDGEPLLYEVEHQEEVSGIPAAYFEWYYGR